MTSSNTCVVDAYSANLDIWNKKPTLFRADVSGSLLKPVLPAHFQPDSKEWLSPGGISWDLSPSGRGFSPVKPRGCSRNQSRLPSSFAPCRHSSFPACADRKRVGAGEAESWMDKWRDHYSTVTPVGVFVFVWNSASPSLTVQTKCQSAFSWSFCWSLSQSRRSFITSVYSRSVPTIDI